MATDIPIEHCYFGDALGGTVKSVKARNAIIRNAAIFTAFIAFSFLSGYTDSSTPNIQLLLQTTSAIATIPCTRASVMGISN